MTEGPSLPPPRYAHTLHVEAPQPKPFSFLLGVALLAFAVPAGLVFAFLRVVAEPAASPAPSPAPAPAPVEAPAALPPAEPVPATMTEGDAQAEAMSTDAAIDSGVVGDAALSAATVDAAPVVDAARPPPAPSHPPMDYELGMGILHSCKNEAGKALEGFQACGVAWELDRYLAKVIVNNVRTCADLGPTTPANLRVDIDFGALTGQLNVVDWKMVSVPSPWATCLASHFGLESLGKINHQHPKYTLTYRVTPHPAGGAGGGAGATTPH